MKTVIIGVVVLLVVGFVAVEAGLTAEKVTENFIEIIRQTTIFTMALFGTAMTIKLGLRQLLRGGR